MKTVPALKSDKKSSRLFHTCSHRIFLTNCEYEGGHHVTREAAMRIRTRSDVWTAGGGTHVWYLQIEACSAAWQKMKLRPHATTDDHNGDCYTAKTMYTSGKISLVKHA